jgi:hypothetical protein
MSIAALLDTLMLRHSRHSQEASVDSNQFDMLVSRLSAHLTRRRSLGLLGVLGMSGASMVHDAEAKKKKKGKKGKGGKKKPQPTTQPPTTRPPTTPPGPTCTDGSKNGDETDVDCGGSCPRCATGKACLRRKDCQSAVCDGAPGAMTCKTCTVGTSCASTIHGDCTCHATASGQAVCDLAVEGTNTTRCEGCPAGHSCVNNPETGYFTCYPLCSL